MLSRLACALTLFAACATAPHPEDGEFDDVGDGKADSGFSAAEQRAAVRVANALTRTELYSDVRLGSRASTNLVAYRSGPDKILGTDDDLAFESFAAVDAISYVGPISLGDMVTYARGKGWVDDDSAFAQLQLVKPTTLGAKDGFGARLALSGTTLAVASPDANPSAPTSHNPGGQYGAVWLYERGANGWQPGPTIERTTYASGFGTAVALDGDTLAVGIMEDGIFPSSYTPRPSVHVFVRTAGAWVDQATLRGQGDNTENFGQALALEGDTLVAGGPGWGGAYVFTRTDGTWTLALHLTDAEVSGAPAKDNSLGSAVAISNGTIAVGEPNSNKVYVYTPYNTTWLSESTLQDGTGNAGYGYSLALQGDTLVVGEVQTPAGSDAIVGSALVYAHSGHTWTQTARLREGTLRDGAAFGESLSLDGDSLAIGANDTDGDYGKASWMPQHGAAYLFERDGETWTLVERRLSAHPQTDAYFGRSLVLGAGTLVVGASGEAGGAVYAD